MAPKTKKGPSKSKSPKKASKKEAKVEDADAPVKKIKPEKGASKKSKKVDGKDVKVSDVALSDSKPEKRKSKKKEKEKTIVANDDASKASLKKPKKEKKNKKSKKKKKNADEIINDSESDALSSAPEPELPLEIKDIISEEEENVEQVGHHQSSAESPYNFDPALTSASYYVGSTGDIINQGFINPDVPIPFCSKSELCVSQPEDGCEDDWGSEEEDEEDNEIQRFSDFFIETEFLLTDAEDNGIRKSLEAGTRSTIGGMKGFRFHYLDMSDRLLHDVSIVEHYTTLKSLNISRNLLKSVRGLGSMLSLIKLDASRNRIECFLDIHTVESCALREVNFSRNQITKILDLKLFSALTIVNLSYNKLTTVEGFEACPCLRVLNLSHNKITEINDLNCPNLIILLLKFNELTTIECLEDCDNLRYLNISNNHITELSSLTFLPSLMELRCQENNIEELLELENLKALIHLSHLCIHPNPCLNIGMSRCLLIHMVPQVRFLDGELIKPDEILESKNTFSPSLLKLAFEDHTNSMLEKACQSSNLIFDEFCRMHPIPPIILLVGSSKSNSNRLATHLKEKFRHDILLSGVHSTATTIEGGNHGLADIPISYESFMDMRNRGEFLATSHILGRMCGFATSQIARAAEKGAILVATVPLVTAICIRKWRFRPRNILVLPSDPPSFDVDKFLRRHHSENKEGKGSLSETHDSAHEDQPKQKTARIVDFGAADATVGHHTAESAANFFGKKTILKTNVETHVDGDDDFELDQTPSSFVNESQHYVHSQEGKNSTNMPDISIEELKKRAIKVEASLVGLSNPSFEEELGEFERHSILDSRPVYCQHPLHLMKIPTFYVSNRLRRLRRLASVLMVQAKETNQSLDYIPDIMMNLPGIELLQSDLLDTIDWKKTILQNHFYNALLETDEAYYMVLTQTTITGGKAEAQDSSRSTIITSQNDLPAHSQHQKETSKPDSQTDGQTKTTYELVLIKEDESSGNSEKDENTSDNIKLTTLKQTKPDSKVEFSEKNLNEIVKEKESQPNAAIIAEKIRTRKKTGFIKEPVSLSDEDLKILPSQNENNKDLAGKIQSKKPILRSSNPLSGHDNEDDKEFVVNEYMNFEEVGVINTLVESDELVNKDTSAKVSQNVTERSRFKHRDAIELSILKTREEYHKFHLENPGFFNAVLDTADLVKSGAELEAIAKEMLKDFRNQLYNVGQFMKSHAGTNVDDEETFIKERVKFLNWCHHEWDKGYQHPLLHMKDRYGVDQNSITFFEKTRSPDNMLDPSLPRHHSSAKIRQLIRIAQNQQSKIEKARMKNELKRRLEEEEMNEFEFEEDLEAFLAEYEGESEHALLGEIEMDDLNYRLARGEEFDVIEEVEKPEFQSSKDALVINQ